MQISSQLKYMDSIFDSTPHYSGYLRIATMSFDGHRIAATNDSGEIILFDRHLPTSEPRKLSRQNGQMAHEGQIMRLSFSQNGEKLVSASKDRTARIWTINEKDISEKTCVGHTAALTSAAFNTAGTQIVTSSTDNSIRIWRSENCQEKVRLNLHTDTVNEVHFSPDDSSILSVSDDGTAKLFQCDSCNEPVAVLRERVHNEIKLSQDELDKLQKKTDSSYFKMLFPSNKKEP